MKEYKVFEAFTTDDGPIILRPRVVVTLKGAYNNIAEQNSGKAYYFFYGDIKDHLRIDIRRKYRHFTLEEYEANPGKCGVCFTKNKEGIITFC